jgi:hypothetical protein
MLAIWTAQPGQGADGVVDQASKYDLEFKFSKKLPSIIKKGVPWQD